MPIPDENHRQPAGAVGRARLHPHVPAFEPRNTVRCVGRPIFTSQTTRDIACLVDVDPEVVSWTTGDGPVIAGAHRIPFDLRVVYPSRIELLMVADEAAPLGNDAVAAAHLAGYRLKALGPDDIAGDRLENARELLRYANWTVSLSDRVRLLAALEQEGSLPLADCLSVIHSGRDPIAAIAALCLRRFVEIDLDSARIGPQTRVAPFRG